jgi:hypothetical protein
MIIGHFNGYTPKNGSPWISTITSRGVFALAADESHGLTVPVVRQIKR